MTTYYIKSRMYGHDKSISEVLRIHREYGIYLLFGEPMENS